MGFDARKLSAGKILLQFVLRKLYLLQKWSAGFHIIFPFLRLNTLDRSYDEKLHVKKSCR